MKVSVQPAPRSSRLTVWRLLQLYLHDMSVYDGRCIGPNGAYAYPFFPRYWDEAGRHPFLVLADGRLAGFALVRELEPGVREIAEFFVLRTHREAGVGSVAASLVVDRFPGQWEIRFHHENLGAAALWNAVATTHGDVKRSGNQHQETLRFTR